MESKEGGIAIGGAAATELDTAVRAMTCRPLRRTHTVMVETGEGGGQELEKFANHNNNRPSD